MSSMTSPTRKRRSRVGGVRRSRPLASRTGQRRETHVPLRFPPGAPAGDRRIVAYRLVFVSDRPDDRDGVELGRLDRGDEVELLGIDRGFAQVRAPDGLEGWIDATTLEKPPD